MWQIRLFVWIIGITAVNTRRFNRPSELSSTEIVITAFQSLSEMYVDGIDMGNLPNEDNGNLTDRIALPSMGRLIAVKGATAIDSPCSGVLASVNDTYFVTNNQWKCSPDGYPGWTDLGYDDSSWPPAVEYGNNGNHATCSGQIHFTDISPTAQWIWSNDQSAFGVYCRGYLPLCQTASPCLNGGTCLPNEKRMCDCTPEFTGTYCESIYDWQWCQSQAQATQEIYANSRCYVTDMSNKNCILYWLLVQKMDAMKAASHILKLMDGTLSITTYQKLQLVYIDGIEQPLTNGNNWDQADSAGLTETNRLIAVRAAGDEICGGLLASFSGDYVLTDGNWKCDKYQYSNWEKLGFDDSAWLSAIEFGNNVVGHTTCSNLRGVPGISDNAKWIWVSEQMEREIFCRGYIPFCDTAPCQNNGTCLRNNVKFCNCLPQFTGDYCEIEILASTTEMTTSEQTTEGITTINLQTTAVTTQPQTTEGITTANRQTTQETTVAETTHGITTDSLQTTDPPTTEAAETTATTTTATTATTSIVETTLTSTTSAPSTAPLTTSPSTSETTSKPPTTPVVSTTRAPTTMPPTTASTAQATSQPPSSTRATNVPTTFPSTSFTGNSTNPGDLPPYLPICTTDEYCNGPFEKPGASIEHCACPADFLNVNNNCCMSQNWIIGLTCLCVAILLLIFIIIIVCICHSEDSDSSIGDSVSLVDSDRMGNDGHSMDVSIVSERKIESHKKPEGGVVDAHGVKNDALHAAADGHLAAEKARHGPETRRHSLASAGAGLNTLRGFNPSGEHTLTQRPIYTLGRRRGQPAYRSMIERGRRDDYFYNPLMVEMLSNDIYRHFRPNMSAIPTNVDYSIQRPEIELEFLYNELYGQDLHRGMYDYNSPWNMNMRL